MPPITPDALSIDSPGGNPEALKIIGVPLGSTADNVSDALAFNVLL
jgi:hypothetical protein